MLSYSDTVPIISFLAPQDIGAGLLTVACADWVAQKLEHNVLYAKPYCSELKTTRSPSTFVAGILTFGLGGKSVEV